jgi:hypothetical protein
LGFWSSNLRELIFKFNLRLHQELHPSNVDTEDVIKSAMAYIPVGRLGHEKGLDYNAIS